MTEAISGGEIQTCTNYLGDGVTLEERAYGGSTRHRWHCFDCGEKGPAEVDGRLCKQQLAYHMGSQHAPDSAKGLGT